MLVRGQSFGQLMSGCSAYSSDQCICRDLYHCVISERGDARHETGAQKAKQRGQR